jgi:hypothetical protein
MHIANLARRVGLFAQRHSPEILTGVAVAGTVITAYLTGKAAYRAAFILREAAAEKANDNDLNEEDVAVILTPREKVELTWKLFIPPVGVAALTITAVICARHIDQRRAAVVAAMYALSERTLNEYREKVTDTLGEKKAHALQTRIGQDHVDRHPVSSSQVIVLPSGNHLAYEQFTDRYFTSNWEAIRSAGVEINEKVQQKGSASLSDFYDLLGLRRTTMSDDIGWTPGHILKMHIDAILTDKNDPCIYFDYLNLPQPLIFRD